MRIQATPRAGGFEVRLRQEVIRVEAWGDGGARVRAGWHRIAEDLPTALADRPPQAADGSVTVEVREDRAVLRNGELTVIAALVDTDVSPVVRLTFHGGGAEQRLLLGEKREHFSAAGARTYTGNRAGSYRIHQQFDAYDGERLYGMGQRTHGRLDIKGLALDLRQRNAEVNIPFVLSSRGYGLLWNSPATGRAEFTADGTRWQADQARQIDYWITAASTPAGILERYADATGHAPELPRWASGFWQSKLRYRTQAELLAVAREYHARGLPLSVIACDYFHWSAMGDFAFDAAEWPDPAAMVAELRSLGVELMVSIWPTVSPLSRNYDEFDARGLLLHADQGVTMHRLMRDKGSAHPLPVAYYDPTNPATRQFVWDLVARNYLSHGIRVWWLDADEPELMPDDPGNLSLHTGPGSEVANLYPGDNARLFAEGMAASRQEPTVLLTRSAWAGAQKYGAAVWSGDIPATWESLRTQIRAGLNIGLSGIPWWTTDIGGFNGGEPADPDYRELLVRWFQFGAFCPLFRLHGDREPRLPPGHDQTGGPNEVWSYGDAAYAVLADVMRLRERLRPYVHEQMELAARRGLPPMRPLFVDHPDDPGAWEVEDEFLFGPDLLVAPVTAPGVRSRTVYLPAGTRWQDLRTGRVVDGGTRTEAEAPIEHIPVFGREGAAVSALWHPHPDRTQR
jgi:alpha-D-xyloside xylohydrolase